MSKKGAPRRYSLAQYATEATREPFPLELTDGTEVKIPQPKYGAVKHFKDGVDLDSVIRALVSEEDAELILADLDEYPADVAVALSRDIQEHFGLGG